jgi:uncharacterized protein (UPF0332 family)
MDIKECLKMEFLTRIKPDDKLIEKEIKESEYDLKRAATALEEGDAKWCIVQSYYSMFHAARAILFSLGYKERRHFAVQIVLEDIVGQGKIENIYLEYFSSAMDCREGADYHYRYSEEIAEDIIENAQKFLDRMKLLLKANKI